MPKLAPMKQDPRLSLRLHFQQGLTFGRGKADLLHYIDEAGSISAAGRRMGMSYRRAWALVDEMNTTFTEPLVDSARGGAGGGGAALTPKGREVLDNYRALEQILRDTGAPHLEALRQSLRPLTEIQAKSEDAKNALADPHAELDCGK